MSDDLAQELKRAWQEPLFGSDAWESVARRARELLGKPAAPMPPISGMTDEEIWDEIFHAYAVTFAYKPLVEKKRAVIALARELLGKPAAPMPPISGMTEKEIREAIWAAPVDHPLCTRTVFLAARVAHSLAQPAPKVDPDKDAKRYHGIYWRAAQAAVGNSIAESDEYLWSVATPEHQAAARAVAKAKEAGDE